MWAQVTRIYSRTLKNEHMQADDAVHSGLPTKFEVGNVIACWSGDLPKAEEGTGWKPIRKNGPQIEYHSRDGSEVKVPRWMQEKMQMRKQLLLTHNDPEFTELGRIGTVCNYDPEKGYLGLFMLQDIRNKMLDTGHEATTTGIVRSHATGQKYDDSESDELPDVSTNPPEQNKVNSQVEVQEDTKRIAWDNKAYTWDESRGTFTRQNWESGVIEQPRSQPNKGSRGEIQAIPPAPPKYQCKICGQQFQMWGVCHIHYRECHAHHAVDQQQCRMKMQQSQMTNDGNASTGTTGAMVQQHA